MATKYRVQGPDGAVHVFEGPDDATPTQVEAFAAQTFGAAPSPQPKPKESGGILGPIRGAIEAGAGLVTGMVTAPIVEGAKIYGTLASGKYGTPEGIRAGEEFGRQFQRNFYQPRTEEGQQYLQAIGEAAAKTGMQGVPLPMLADLSRSMATATRAVPLTQQVKTSVQAPFEPLLQGRRERLSAESYAKGPQLDAAAEAQRLKLVINPTEIDNSVRARFYSAAAGPRGPEALAAANRPRVNEIAKNELGIDPNTPLTSAAPFKQARANLAAPYDEVKKLPIQQADAAMVQRLEAIRSDMEVIGAKDYAPAISKIVDDAISKTQTGLTGETLLKNISVLRERAKKTYNNKSATTEALDIADTNLKIATELESMIDGSIANPKLLEQYRDARQKMARTYAYESATDFNTGLVDPLKLARLTAKDNALTGDIASIGRIVGNNPEAFTTGPPSKFFSAPRLTRSGVPGSLGALAGSYLGTPGLVIGGLAGSALGEFGGAAAARRMANPNYQAGLTLQDYRIPVNQLAAAAAPIPQNRAVVPFDPRNALVQPTDVVGYASDGTPITAEQAFSRPNFVPGRPEAQVNVGTQYAPNQLPAPSAESTLGTVAVERARAAQMSRTLGQQTEAQQAAAEAAARVPTSGGSVLDFDPITGRYKVGGAGIKGATPDVLEATGKAAITAAEKVRANQQFLMSAEEKIQWGKSLLEGMPIDQGELMFGKLSPQQITNKMADREWVAGRITKAREQAQAFDEIAARATTDQARRTAEMKREQMLDVLNTLEDQLRAPRPTSLGGQGPKTRAAIRNKLAPQDTGNQQFNFLSGQ